MKYKTILCYCSAEVTLRGALNRCPACGSEYDQTGKCTLPRWTEDED